LGLRVRRCIHPKEYAMALDGGVQYKITSRTRESLPADPECSNLKPELWQAVQDYLKNEEVFKEVVEMCENKANEGDARYALIMGALLQVSSAP